jgi:enoyl-CoA hydratase/carnithine racemase
VFVPDTRNSPAAGTVLSRSDDSGVATLTLNRPQQFNALSSALIDELQSALDAIARDESVRVLVLAGAGRAFCAGHDLKELRGNPDQGFAQDVFERASRMMLTLTRLPQPVIARVHGVAAAAGCQLIAQCDLAVASTEARFATSGINVGLFCATPAVPLSRNLARKPALEMLLTGEFIDAGKALALGLVNRVVDATHLDAEVKQLSDAILTKSPAAIAAGKKAFYEQLDASLEGAYEIGSKAMASNLMLEDAAEGIDAFIAKRKPLWKGK